MRKRFKILKTFYISIRGINSKEERKDRVRKIKHTRKHKNPGDLSVFFKYFKE